MTNPTTYANLMNYYTATAYTENYILGFSYNGMIYARFCEDSILPFVCTLDKASRGAGYAIRFKPTKAQKEILVNSPDCMAICSVEFFNELCESNKYNKGENFELLIANKYHMAWQKDNLPYTDGPDMVINGTPYQLKFEKATLINEKQAFGG